ncbi:MAG: hypothetical protein A2X49_01475 [Lentisphaerae bacterium GWF2_52_8]|nr:MAG: hypothetical protein A2X49_01475 [Lentisphaerae bacterium GWF2_52_8]
MRQKDSSAGLKCRRYTLVELLMVIGIMLIIFGISLPAFNKIGKAQALPASIRQISAEMHLARAYAIEQRKYIAVAFYQTGDTPRKYAIRPFIVVKSGNYYQIKSYVPNEDWQFLPVGVTFGVNVSSTTDIFGNPTTSVSGTTDTCTMKGFYSCAVGAAANSADFSNSFQSISYNKKNYCFYVYKPTGQLDSQSTNDIMISLRPLEENMKSPFSNAADKSLKINQYTGRVTFEE